MNTGRNAYKRNAPNRRTHEPKILHATDVIQQAGIPPKHPNQGAARAYPKVDDGRCTNRHDTSTHCSKDELRGKHREDTYTHSHEHGQTTTNEDAFRHDTHRHRPPRMKGQNNEEGKEHRVFCL